jgi:CheY-like chemotaxis protein
MKTIYKPQDCTQVKYKILVVDDSKTFNQKITDALNKLGHTITQSYTFKQTEDLLEKDEYDFILLDLILPDGDGDELIDKLNDETKSKVIVLSADSDNQRRNHIFESGILDYFSKTNPTHKIIEDIKNLLCTVEQNSSINILIVDDSSFMRKMLKSVLIPKRFNVFEAKNGINGIDILNQKDIHLVVLDYEMPGMDGITMIEQVKKDIKFLELPIIMISGNDHKDIVARALKNGASDFLKKPFATEELLLKCDLHVKDYINVQKIKQKEEQLASALEKTKIAEQHKALFLANMSHEIRTPLNAIIGFVNLLEEEELDETKKNHFKTIQKSGDLLLNIINDILDFSKIESNKLDINKENFVIDELYHLIISLYSPTIKEKNLNFKTTIDINLPKYFNSDFLRIKQIITNLLSNAIKFTPENGEIGFAIRLTEDKKNIEFSISDTGIGIDPKNHQKIFELFSQAESTTTKKFGGTGLGLSISSKLVSILGGEISIQSELGEGSNFFFSLPIQNNDTNKNIIHHKEEKLNNPTLQFNSHILLVEDNITNQQFMSILLKKYGLTFDIASDGIEAIEKFKLQEYDLILMDENMPNLSGIDTTKTIRSLQREQNLKYTPIIALTANALKGDRDKFIKAGMDEYLTKPVNKERLSFILDEFLDKQKIDTMLKIKNKKSDFPEPFIIHTKKAITPINNAIENEQYEDIVKYINLIRILTIKYKLTDIFKICWNIEKSAKQKDKQSCLKLIRNLTEML